LYDIGISIGTDGSLSLSDTTKLQDALKNNPQKVAALFTTPTNSTDPTQPEGFAANLYDTIKNFTGQGGLILMKTKLLGDQINQTAQKTTDLQSRIDAQAETLRKQYEDQLMYISRLRVS